MAKSRSTTTSTAPWHPNFRDATRLPDVRVVRTNIFANIITGALLLSVLLYAGRQEYEIADLRRAFADRKAEVAAVAEANEASLASGREFDALAARINEVSGFVTQNIPATQLLLEVAASVPQGIRLKTVTYNLSEIELTGSIVGDVTTAADVADRYIRDLRTNTFFKARLPIVVLQNVIPLEDRMDFVIKLRPPPPPAAPK